jgi:hypothetical protein
MADERKISSEAAKKLMAAATGLPVSPTNKDAAIPALIREGAHTEEGRKENAEFIQTILDRKYDSSGRSESSRVKELARQKDTSKENGIL